MPCVYFNVCCQCMFVDHKLHNPESSSGECKCQKEKRMRPLHCFVKIINKVNFFNDFLCLSDCLNRIAHNGSSYRQIQGRVNMVATQNKKLLVLIPLLLWKQE